MIEVVVSKDIIKKAKKRADKLGCLRNSILRGKGNVYGFIGELVVADYLKCEIGDSFDFDLIKDSLKLEVKTKCCSSVPKSFYECSISAANAKQKCDYYIFVRVKNDMTTAWILGAKSSDAYFKAARFCKEGEVDENNKSKLKWRFKADCFNLPISKLIKIEKFIEKFK